MTKNLVWTGEKNILKIIKTYHISLADLGCRQKNSEA
jgi:hypothetical protein